MRLLHRRDPAMAESPEELEISLNRFPGSLARGLVAGVAMLLIAAALTYVGALLLQQHAQETAQSGAHPATEDARRDTVPPVSGAQPDGRSVGRPGAPMSAPSPGPNPTPSR